jgi:vacuolar-type H+-ATPase subunit F/Vma7
MNARRFFENIKLDENGNIIIIVEDVVNPINKGISQYNTFQKLEITAQGELKVYKE